MLAVFPLVVAGFLSSKFAVEALDINIFVDTSDELRSQSDEYPYVCVTMDWWPENKCDSPDLQSDCAWANSSILSAPIDSIALKSAIQSLGHVTLRLGGTLADEITYAVGSDEGIDCPDYAPQPPTHDRIFTGGCLTSSRWDEVLSFCDPSTGCDLVFGINAMRGRECLHQDKDHAACFQVYDECTSSWDWTNAEALIRHTAASGYRVSGYELGNELACLTAQQYIQSVNELHSILVNVSTEFKMPIPTLSATDLYFPNLTFLGEFIPAVSGMVESLTWHQYPLGAGVNCSGANAENNTDVDRQIMNPKGMVEFFAGAEAVTALIAKTDGDGASSMTGWMGESGGAFNSGCNGSTNAFMSGFWYLNALGGLAIRGQDKFCRQTLIGGNYELVDKVTLAPNPDYYTALLYGKLMGPQVLRVYAELAPKNPNNEHELANIVIYGHCARGEFAGAAATGGEGVVIAYLNYNTEDVVIDHLFQAEAQSPSQGARSMSLTPREEYVLTGVATAQAVDAMHSNRMALNGELLSPDDEGKVPTLEPRIVSAGPVEEKLVLPGLSYGFVAFPELRLEACEK